MKNLMILTLLLFLAVACKTEAVEEQLQVVQKRWNPATGESLDDFSREYRIRDVSSDIDRCKSEVSSIQARQADLEQLEKDLKAL